ncbi:MAG TPA: Eco57I restriction-modification methylase domain-containing protein [Thermoleophilaceae bacterium]|nr:Eco57I restriction-modification methylase domain-containing protein [Thermoleophilaceae bacterium]
MQVRDRQHVPDILDCLAQLSSDEVPTPPKLARAMLDLLPEDVWSDPTLRWLDPCCKSGVFLREIIIRLLEGLAEWQPDFEKRREHIFRSMVFGAAITEVTGYVSRRTVYYSRDASGDQSVVRFDEEAGNLPFVPAVHDFEKGRCRSCGAPEDLERGDARENYAYAFLHGAYPTEEMREMKFDVIVGNPPYQIDSDGNTRTKAIYQLFVERAIDMNPRYVLMITPSRWFAGGLGLDGYRARMLKDHRLAKVVDYPQSKDCFPGVKIRGGVSYFLWDRNHSGGCTVRTVRGNVTGQPMTRNLDAYDVFVRFNEGVGIIEKVRSKGNPTMDQRVSPLVPFGLRAKFRDYVAADSPGAIALHVMGRKIEWIDPSSVTNHEPWVSKWKTLLHAAYGEDNEGPYSVIANPLVAAPESACTETYLVIGAFDTQEEAENLAAFLRTRFARFLIWLRMNTQHIRRELFAFVPDLDWTRSWTDDDLYRCFGLTEAEIATVEANIKEMSAPEFVAA